MTQAVEGPNTVLPPNDEEVPPHQKEVSLPQKPSKKPAVWHLAVAQFLSLFAVALVVPVVPLVWTDTPAAGGDDVKATSLYSLSEFITAACELFSSALLGVLSDRFGRKPFMLLSCLGQLVEVSVAALVCNDRNDYLLHLEHGASWLFVAKGFGGLCGSLVLFTKAYVGDVSAVGESARNFAVIIAMIGIAFVIGPPIGAIVSKGHLQVPFLISTVLVILNICWISLIEESLRPEHRVAFRWRRANPVGVLHFLLSRHFLIFFGCMAFLDQFSLTLLQTMLLQYCRIQFGVDQIATSMLLVVFGVGQAITYALVLRPLVRWRGEASAMKLGYILTCSAFALLAIFSYFTVFWLTFLAMVVFALGAISNPTENSIASRAVDKNEQGRLQAANACLDIVGKMAGSLIAFAIWKPTARAGQPGAVWWFACGVMLCGVVLSFYLVHLLPKHLRASTYCHRSDSSLSVEEEEECEQQPHSVVPGSDLTEKSSRQSCSRQSSDSPVRKGCKEAMCCPTWPFH